MWPLPLRAAAGAAVGWLLVDVGSSEPAEEWARPVVAVLLAAVAAGAVGMVRRWARRAVATGSCLAAFLGIYACVPETQRVGATALIVAVLVVGELAGQLRASWPVVVAAAALVLWAAYDGGVFRDSALVGGFAALGLAVLEPVAVRLPGPGRGLPMALTAPALLVRADRVRRCRGPPRRTARRRRIGARRGRSDGGRAHGRRALDHRPSDVSTWRSRCGSST